MRFESEKINKINKYPIRDTNNLLGNDEDICEYGNTMVKPEY